MATRNKKLTIIVVPQTSKRSYSFSLAPTWVAALVVTIVGISAGLSTGVWIYKSRAEHLRTELVEVESLRKTNRLQQAEIEKMQLKTQQVQARLQELETLEQQVRQLTGQEAGAASRSGGSRGESAPGASGRGGPQASAARQENLPTLAVQLPPEVRSYVLGRRDTLQLDLLLGSAPSRSDHSLETAILANQTLDGQLASLDQFGQALAEGKEEIAQHIDYLAHRPTGLPVSGAEITDRFGTRWSPFGWGQQMHEGIDFAMAPWTPIVATADGVISHAGWKSGGYGYAVMIDHGYGLQTLYAHMVDWNVEYGQDVKRGDVIGWVGNTGLSTGPHCHYEVHLNGVPVDPTDYFN